MSVALVWPLPASDETPRMQGQRLTAGGIAGARGCRFVPPIPADDYWRFGYARRRLAPHLASTPAARYSEGANESLTENAKALKANGNAIRPHVDAGKVGRHTCSSRASPEDIVQVPGLSSRLTTCTTPFSTSIA